MTILPVLPVPIARRPVLIVLLLTIQYSLAFRVSKGKSPIVNSRRNDSFTQTSSLLVNEAAVSTTALYSMSVKFKNFDQVLDCFHGEPILIYFSTTRCGPCQLMKKELKQAHAAIGNRMKMFQVDTEKWPKVASRLEVASLPCLVVFREGQTILRLEGLTTAESIVEHVNAVVL
eukprot:scaffold1475_cov111-Cylindrotheca_fusiformis.AAC.11